MQKGEAAGRRFGRPQQFHLRIIVLYYAGASSAAADSAAEVYERFWFRSSFVSGRLDFLSMPSSPNPALSPMNTTFKAGLKSTVPRKIKKLSTRRTSEIKNGIIIRPIVFAKIPGFTNPLNPGENGCNQMLFAEFVCSCFLCHINVCRTFCLAADMQKNIFFLLLFNHRKARSSSNTCNYRSE